MPQEPPRSSCLQHSTAPSGAKGARLPAEPLHPVLQNANENPGQERMGIVVML